jgi:hypothetical protein
LLDPGCLTDIHQGRETSILLDASRAGRMRFPDHLVRKRDWVVTRNDRLAFQPLLCGEWIRIQDESGTRLVLNDKCKDMDCPCAIKYQDDPFFAPTRV